MSQSHHQRIHDFVAATREARTRFLAELVTVPTDNPPGDCAAHAARAAEFLEAMGFAVERHPVPAAAVAENGMISAVNLIVRRRFGDGPTIALNAHGDVVPPGAGWSHDPYGAEIVDGAMYGRGVAVSKSDFATYAYALKALEAAGTAWRGAVELHFTYDEEAGGGIGPQWILEHGLSTPDYAISAGFSYGVVTAHNGCLHLEVVVRGRQAHAAMPETGRDALEGATSVLAAIYRFREILATRSSAVAGIGAPTVIVGLISGGVNTNVVPDRVTLRIDRRLIPEEDGEAVEAELKAVIDDALAGHPGLVGETRRIMLARPLTPLPGSEALIAPLIAHGSRIMGEPIAAHGVPLYTDARYYTRAGIPTVLYGAGPHGILEANAHGADEHLVLDDLDKATEVVALTLADMMSADGSA